MVPAAPAARPPAPKSRYAMGSASNMLRSLLVILALVAGLIMLVPRVTEVRQPPVDAFGVAAAAVRDSGTPYWAPVGLPEGWVSTVARYGPWTDSVRTWQAGWTTPTGGFVGLKQATAPTDSWLSVATSKGVEPKAPAASTAELGGRSWQVLVDERGQTHLVNRDGGLTTVVSSLRGMPDASVFVPALAPVAAAR